MNIYFCLNNLLQQEFLSHIYEYYLEVIVNLFLHVIAIINNNN